MDAQIVLHHEVSQWLFREAELLDGGNFAGWLELLAPEIRYVVPVRVTRQQGEGDGHQGHAAHFEDNLFTLTKRVKRLESKFAWAEDPPSRTRHFVSNVRVESGDDDLVRARSSLLLHRSRGDSPGSEQLAGERRDTLVRTPGGLRLRERLVLLDHSTLPVQNMAILL